MTTATTLESKETVSLIASDKVEGTAVYGTEDKKIGKLERVMIDKMSGKVAYRAPIHPSPIPLPKTIPPPTNTGVVPHSETVCRLG